MSTAIMHQSALYDFGDLFLKPIANLCLRFQREQAFQQFSQFKAVRFLKWPGLASKPPPPLFLNGQALQKPSSAVNNKFRSWESPPA
ncbi:hypothetical protein RR48_07527 [Papilio machaon]|uniref:Uncharacterized protein n=1 Tax=Papilio machaon TaxID=76193 RepID=A0A194RRG8_PAPMA|nr:hypothetical protein RR48_07527 [Papilio machaon]